MKKFAFICLFNCCAALLTMAQTPEKFARVRIDLAGKDMAALAALGIEIDHGAFLPGRSLTTVLSTGELQLVTTAGYATEVLIPDLQAWHRAQALLSAAQPRSADCAPGAIGDYPTPANYTYGSMAGYFTHQEMLDILDDMAVKFPNLISPRATVSDSILTHDGNSQWWVRVSDNPNIDEDEPEVLYTALHHAREPNSLSQMIFYLWYLLENYDDDPEVQYILNNAELYFIPCVNPDGYLYNEFTNPDGFGYWRKNRRDNGDGTYGIDLNRNYGYQWGFNDSGSSPNTASETYRGAAAFSEPETRMVRDFCVQHDFVFVFNYHTSGNLLIYPWGYADALAEPGLAELAKLFTRENHFKAGVATETVGYYVNGTSDDWMYGATGAFAYTPEVGPSFWPPVDQIDGLNRSNMWQNLSMALCALRFGEVQDQSPLSFPNQNFSVDFEVRRFGFQDGPLTVSLTPLTANVASVSAQQVFDLAQFESAQGAFTVTLAPSALAGQAVNFVLTLDSGGYLQTDTLYKVIAGTTYAVLEDAGNDLDNWGTAYWNTTAESFVSPPTSLTDSPNDIYFPNDYNPLLLIEPVHIPANALNPVLKFYARWEIEDFFDYTVFLGGGDDGLFTPLCGTYTSSGSFLQLPGEPIYDGFQTEWVLETMALDDYAGQNFTLEIDLVSNEAQEYDGFYLDDLRIEYFDPATSGTVTVPFDGFRLRQSQPNPAADRAVIRWDNPGAGAEFASLLIFNALGEKVGERQVDLKRQNQISLDVQNWPNGIYSYQLRTAGWQSPALKMTVAR